MNANNADIHRTG